MKILIPLLLFVLVQQWYARVHESGVEQPIGYFGIAEYLFRHPEMLIGLRFNYPSVEFNVSEELALKWAQKSAQLDKRHKSRSENLREP